MCPPFQRGVALVGAMTFVLLAGCAFGDASVLASPGADERRLQAVEPGREFLGRWSEAPGIGQVGRPPSVIEIRSGPNVRTLRLEYGADAPAAGRASGTVTQNAVSGELVMRLSPANRGRDRIYRATGWLNDTLTFDEAPSTDGKRTRIAVRRVASDRFTATVEDSLDAGRSWSVTRTLVFDRVRSALPPSDERPSRSTSPNGGGSSTPANRHLS